MSTEKLKLVDTSAPPRLALEGITVTFDGVPAVSDLSLDVGAGEIVCLLGPSGCGKTTTLRVAAGVERQKKGGVLIDGRLVSEKGNHAPPEERSIGLMFQDFALFPHLTVAGNVAFGLRRIATPDKRATLVAEYLDRVGLEAYSRKFPHQLSGGEQQRVALARALAPRPRVMLMDEPFSGLDNRLRDEVRDHTLSILKEEGAGVLLVTHDPDEAMRMADRIALMREGRIVQIGAPYHVYNYPVDRQAAGFFSDINIIHGVVCDRQTDTPFGLFLAPKLVDGADVEIVIRPQHLRIEPDNTSRNATSDVIGDVKLPEPTAEHGMPAGGSVARARFVGAASLIEVAMDHDGSILRVSVPYAWLPEPGARVWLSMRRDRCFVFPCIKQSRVASPHAAE